MRKKTILSILLLAIFTTTIFGILAPISAEFPFPPTTLDVKNDATSAWTTSKAYTGFYSVHLNTTGIPGVGDTATIIIDMPIGTTLDDIDTISWEYWLVAGYAPHVDIMLDTNDDTVVDEALVFEYAYNYAAGTVIHGPGATGAWYTTFDDDIGNDGPAAITDTTMAWATKGCPGPLSDIGAHDGSEHPGCPATGFWFYSLADWKAGKTITTDTTKTIDGDTPVLALEFEIDNWIVQTEAYIDDIEINGLDIMGLPGPKGDTGATGSKGDRGSRGLTGSQGPIGLQGEQGEAGLAGEDGSDGLQGPKGDVGLSGSQGIAGETGPSGATGDAGSQGVAGEAGPQGPKGETGDTGAVGPKGAKGEPAPTSVAYGGAALGGVSLLGLLYMFFRTKP